MILQKWNYINLLGKIQLSIYLWTIKIHNDIFHIHSNCYSRLVKKQEFSWNFQENETFCESFGFKHTTANNQEIKFKFGICSSPPNSRSNPTWVSTTNTWRHSNPFWWFFTTFVLIGSSIGLSIVPLVFVT